VPLKVRVAPVPEETVPDRIHVDGVCEAVKFTPARFAPLIVTARLEGVIAKPAFVAVTL
jgi:hypothetical protein